MGLNVFLKLAQDKRDRIISSAMKEFASHGYQKTSVSDIARSAGISKAMVFTYFGSKCGCFEFICNEMMRIAKEEFAIFQEKILSVSDYFDRIILSARIKIDVLKKCPSLLDFAVSLIKEKDEEVKHVIQEIMTEGHSLRQMLLTTKVDSTKFKNPEDADRIGKMAEWISAGCADEWMRSGQDVLDIVLADFIDCMNLLKRNFYREEYI